MQKHGRRLPASVCRKTSIVIKNGVWGVAPSRVRAAAPHSARHGCRACMPKGSARCRANKAYTALHHGEGVFGKDAEIRTHQALHEAKLSECPKGDRDREFAIFLKNKFFLQSEADTRLSEDILSSNSFADFTLYLSLSDYDGELLCITH